MFRILEQFPLSHSNVPPYPSTFRLTQQRPAPTKQRSALTQQRSALVLQHVFRLAEPRAVRDTFAKPRHL